MNGDAGAGAVPAGRPEVWCRDDLEPGWAADAVALDVDGVLIDVRGSFGEAVLLTVSRALQELTPAAPAWRPSADDMGALKAAGGFNDDIDVGIALTAIGLAGRCAELREIASAVDAAGGGLGALRRVAPGLPRVPGGRIRAIFETLYWGADGAVDAGPPTPSAPLIHRERLLTDDSLPARLRAAGARSVAIVSGRTPRELEAGLAKLGWSDTDLDVIVTGDQHRKPDPACLDRVVAVTGCRRLVFVGDVRDDWELVRRYRAERPGGAATRGVLVGGVAELAPLRALGCDATVDGVDDVVGLVARWSARRPQ